METWYQRIFITGLEKTALIWRSALICRAAALGLMSLSLPASAEETLAIEDFLLPTAYASYFFAVLAILYLQTNGSSSKPQGAPKKRASV